MNKTLIRSNAKVNLSLNVLGRKKNGFHNIQSIYSFLDYHDEIYIRSIKGGKHRIKFKGKFSKNIKNNSVSKLLKILDEKKLLKNRYDIQIKKKIPLKSGLGGGSMNASALLSYFLKKKIIKLTKNEIFNICNHIGSDVVLGLKKKNSILINNNLIKNFNVKLGLFVILIKPRKGCSTKEIYRRVNKFSKNKIKSSSSVFKINFLKNAQNDLEMPAFKLYPVLRKLKVFLSNVDDVKFVRMTGSGSAILAYFINKKSAINGLKLLKKNFKNYWSILSKTI